MAHGLIIIFKIHLIYYFFYSNAILYVIFPSFNARLYNGLCFVFSIVVIERATQPSLVMAKELCHLFINELLHSKINYYVFLSQNKNDSHGKFYRF